MQIDVEAVAKEMISRGIVPEDIRRNIFDGYSDTLLDVLENKYNLETAVTDALKKCW